MDTALKVTTERVDDIVLLLQVMMRMGLPDLLNEYLPRHWKQEGLDWGWVAVIWLSYMISQGDHRKVQVQEWVNQRRYMLEQVCGIELRDTDFTDDRLGILLRRLSGVETWVRIETALSQRTIQVYELCAETVRLDATTVSGYRMVDEAGLFQFGHSKDDPTLPQIKVMLGVLDPLGLPIVTQVVSGERADDGLYIPAIAQVQQSVAASRLLYVGDCKMSALAIRAHLAATDNYYLCPLSATGHTPDLLAGWIEAAVSGQVELMGVELNPEREEKSGFVEGYEVERELEARVDGTKVTWTERVLVVCSPTLAHQQQQGLAQRLETATQKLLALTPQPGRGKRQITEVTDLQQKATAILQQHRVSELLSYDYEFQDGAKPRYQMTQVHPQTAAIAAQHQRYGWRAYVTNAPVSRLAFETAISTYRDEWIVEQGFGRLKGLPLSIAPIFVQRDDQVMGLTHLLSLALRVLTLIEFVVRRQLQSPLVGLDPAYPRRATRRPTAEAILRAFSNLTLTLVEVQGQQLGHAPPLSALQQQLIQLLGLPPNIYSSLAQSSA